MHADALDILVVHSQNFVFGYCAAIIGGIRTESAFAFLAHFLRGLIEVVMDFLLFGNTEHQSNMLITGFLDGSYA